MADQVAVVGGGAVGVTAAHDLATAGVDVTLYERDELASGASGRAAGIVYDAFAEDRDIAVASRALERFRTIDDEGAISLTPCPYVWLARAGDGRAVTAIREQVPRMRDHGRDVELLDQETLEERFPALETADVAIAAVARDAGYLDPESYVTAMAERTRNAGVDVQTGTEAAVARGPSAPTVETGRTVESYDAVLVAAGAHSKRILADAGVSIAMKPYRVQALVTDPIDTEVPITYDATGGYYFRPRAGGVLVGDGTEEREFDPSDYDREADEAFQRVSRERIQTALGADVSVRRAWAGLCTATPDRDPLLGPVDDEETLYVATGLHGHGFMRAPALGEAIAEQMAGGDGISAFDPRRFDGDETFDVVEGMTVEE